MAEFLKAHNWSVGTHEGFYSNDPDDLGGETLFGWARNYHKRSQLWKLVDKAKAKRPHKSAEQALLAYGKKPWWNAVLAEYRKVFWQPICGDWLPSQYIADAMYDVGVNGGVGRAVKFLQHSLNSHNRYGKDYADLKVDGAMGAGSRAALTAYLKKRKSGEFILANDIYSQMNAHYLQSKQEKFTNGWSARTIKNYRRAAANYFLSQGWRQPS